MNVQKFISSILFLTQTHLYLSQPGIRCVRRGKIQSKGIRPNYEYMCMRGQLIATQWSSLLVLVRPYLVKDSAGETGLKHFKTALNSFVLFKAQ